MSADGVGPQAARDPGLQAERTALAWSRTSLAVFVNALLALRAGWAAGQTPLMLLALALLIAAAAVLAQGRLRRRQLLHAQVPEGPHVGVMQATAVVAFLASGVGLWSVLVA